KEFFRNIPGEVEVTAHVKAAIGSGIFGANSRKGVCTLTRIGGRVTGDDLVRFAPRLGTQPNVKVRSYRLIHVYVSNHMLKIKPTRFVRSWALGTQAMVYGVIHGVQLFIATRGDTGIMMPAVGHVSNPQRRIVIFEVSFKGWHIAHVSFIKFNTGGIE